MARKDCGCHCPSCSRRHTKACIDGGRCTFCGTSLASVQKKDVGPCPNMGAMEAMELDHDDIPGWAEELDGKELDEGIKGVLEVLGNPKEELIRRLRALYAIRCFKARKRGEPPKWTNQMVSAMAGKILEVLDDENIHPELEQDCIKALHHVFWNAGFNTRG
jgi:hypothetical protein